MPTDDIGRRNQERAERRARQRKIRRKLARLRKIRARIKLLKDVRPARWRARVMHWERVAGRLRRQLKRLGWRPPAKSSDPLDETMEQDRDEQLPEPGGKADPEEQDIPEEDEGGEGEGGNDANEDGLGGECRCKHPNWIHGDEATPGGKVNFMERIRRAAASLDAGKWLGTAVAVGTQGKLHTRPGQRALVMDVAPGLHLIQFVPSTMVGPGKGSGLGDEVGVLPLLLVPGIAKKVGTMFQKVQEPAPGQLGHPATPPAPRPPGEAPPSLADELAGRRRRRRPARRARQQEQDEGEEEEEEEQERRPRRGGRRGGGR